MALIVSGATAYVLIGLGVGYAIIYFSSPTNEAGNIAFASLVAWPVVLVIYSLLFVVNDASDRGEQRFRQIKARKQEQAEKSAELDRIIKEHAL